MNSVTTDSIRKCQLYLLLPVMLLAGCGKAPEPVEEQPARPVKLLTIGSQQADVTLEYPGEIKAALYNSYPSIRQVFRKYYKSLEKV